MIKRNREKTFGGINDSRIVIDGENRVLIENCKRVLSYSKESISLRARVKVTVNGENLDLLSYSNDNVGIVGKIKAVSFDE